MFCVLLIFCCSLFIFPQCNAGDPCPKEDALSPCTCTQISTKTESEMPTKESLIATTLAPRRKRDMKDKLISPEFVDETSLYTTVQCKRPKTLYVLEDKISSALDRKWIDKLVLSEIPPETGNTLARLPSDWLKTVRIRQLEIQNTQLCEDFIWNGAPLNDQVQSLYWLTVKNCYLSGALTYDTVGTIQTRGLHALRRLQGVDFSSNHLTAILLTAFKVFPVNLTTIILARNNIQHIDAGAFQHIPLLKYIDLSHNLLKSVLRSYFAAPTRILESINLSWNSIRTLPVDFFVNMPALKSVDISNNFLYSLPAKPWSIVWKQLSYIDVSGNFVECDCELMWLLPLLPPPNSNLTTPKPLPGQTVSGRCTQPQKQQQLQTVNHELLSLTKDRITC